MIPSLMAWLHMEAHRFNAWSHLHPVLGFLATAAGGLSIAVYALGPWIAVTCNKRVDDLEARVLALEWAKKMKEISQR